MWPNPQFPAHLVAFTEEIFNGNFIFCAVLLPQESITLFMIVGWGICSIEVYKKGPGKNQKENQKLR